MNGTFILAEFKSCSKKDLLVDEVKLSSQLKEIVRKSGLEEVGYSSKSFEGGGVTACILLSESHLNIHTWPEKDDSLVLDIFTCDYENDNKNKVMNLFNMLEEAFAPESVNKKYIVQDNLEENDTLKEFFDSKHGFFIVPKKRIAKKKSKFQEIELFDTEPYGKLLRIDNYFQTSEKDEFFYHEPLVQIPMFSHPNPSKVLVIGGGDGGVIEEVLKHNCVKEVVMVELDEEVIDFSKKHLFKINKGAFDDSRLKLVIGDGLDFVKNNDEKFDVIILDLTDPVGEANALYTIDFYNSVKKRLDQGGVLSLHAEYPLVWPNAFGRIVTTLRKVFSNVTLSFSFIPIYGTIMSFACCSENICPENISKELIKKRFEERGVDKLRCYGPETHNGIISVPNYIKDILDKEYDIITSENPITEIEEGFNYANK